MFVVVSNTIVNRRAIVFDSVCDNDLTERT